MKQEFKNSRLALIVSVVFVVVGFTIQWAIGKQFGQKFGGSLILVGLLMFSFSLYSILKKNGN